MNSINCVKRCIKINKAIRKVILFGGVAATTYVGIKKAMDLVEDRRLSRYYEDEIEEIYKERERMKFYEDEFIRQEQEEKENLKKAVDEFNNRRLKRESCPHCGE